MTLNAPGSSNLQSAILSALDARPFSTDELHALPSVRDASGGNVAKVAQELGALQQKGIVGRQSRYWILTTKGQSVTKAVQGRRDIPPSIASSDGLKNNLVPSVATSRQRTPAERSFPVTIEPKESGKPDDPTARPIKPPFAPIKLRRRAQWSPECSYPDFKQEAEIQPRLAGRATLDPRSRARRRVGTNRITILLSREFGFPRQRIWLIATRFVP
jgi:hypothetical protein